MSTIPCPDCGAPAATPYCAACGQRQPRAGDFSWRHMATEGWTELSGSDSRIWRTLKAFFVPGELTAAYVGYRWGRYLPPLRLYLIAAGIYFLLAWDVYHRPTVQYMLAAPESAVPASVRALYADPATSARLSDLTAILKFVSVLAMAGWVALLTVTLRRPAATQLVFALHYTATDFVIFSLLAPVVALAPADWQAGMTSLVVMAGVLLLGLWAVFAVHRVYAVGWLRACLLGPLILLGDVVMSAVAGQSATIWLLVRAA